MSPMSMRASIEDKGIRYDDVAAIRYRGYGCPGPTTITMRNGDQHEFTYLEFWGEDESSWGLPPRCKVCADGIGESADIAAADCWVGGSPSAQDSASDPGRNAVIVRTERGEALMRDAIAANYLQREDTLTPADLNRFQPHQETKKRAVHARYRALHAAGKVYPQTSGLRLQQLWNMNSEQQNALEEAGTKLRIEQGKFSESEH